MPTLGSGSASENYSQEKNALGRVVETAVPVIDFKFEGKSILECNLTAPKFAHDLGDTDWCEFVVRVKWEKTFPLSEAKTFRGAFANQNIVCKLRDPATITFLEQHFPIPKIEE